MAPRWAHLIVAAIRVHARPWQPACLCHGLSSEPTGSLTVPSAPLHSHSLLLPPKPSLVPLAWGALGYLRPHRPTLSIQEFPASCLSLRGPATSLSSQPGVCVPARPAFGCPGPLTLQVQSPSSSRSRGAKASLLTSLSHSLPRGRRRLQKHRQRPWSLLSAPVQCPLGTAAQTTSEQRPQCPCCPLCWAPSPLWPVPSSHRPAAWPCLSPEVAVRPGLLAIGGALRGLV